MHKRRVVITGLGVVSSIGIGIEHFRDALFKGASGISKVTAFDTSGLRCHYAGEIKNFNPDKFIRPQKSKYLGRTSQMALTAAKLCIDDAHMTKHALKSHRAGVFIGTTIGERPLEESLTTWFMEGTDKVVKTKLAQSTPNNISANIAIAFGLTGPNYIFSNACASANFALGFGYDLIQSGELNYAFTGGADSFSKMNFCGFHRLYAMSPDRCQPFDKNRKGMILGDGAGILLLEELESALSRKAEIYAEVLGYGLSCDAHHITAPKITGIEKAMRKALHAAHLQPGDIEYINAHGTGTPSNDKAECAAIKRVFGTHTRQLLISSTKSMIGHTMGAAAAIESVAALLALKHQIIPPTINFETPDPECDIDCVPNHARAHTFSTILKNSSAFGGNNACVIFRKYVR